MHVFKLFDLTGKVALVTGGAGHYGTCIVEGLIEAGATVVVTSRRVDQATQDLAEYLQPGYSLTVLELDQESISSIDSFMQKLKQRYVKVDVFVNNAVSRPMKGISRGYRSIPAIYGSQCNRNVLPLT